MASVTVRRENVTEQTENSIPTELHYNPRGRFVLVVVVMIGTGVVFAGIITALVADQ
ncbi:LOW QUALITY PROTEIN: hypothetical protein YC2023_050620 [Brassica napus]